MKISKDKRGFTLIELMIVVAIIGILAAIAVPNFIYYQCLTQQSEARSSLGAIKTQLITYKIEHDTYNATLGQIGFSTVGNSRYTYTIANATTSNFDAVASAMINNNTDNWSITENATLTNNTRGCQ
jgi:type IV pilus assembly protein PilA